MWLPELPGVAVLQVGRGVAVVVDVGVAAGRQDLGSVAPEPGHLHTSQVLQGSLDTSTVQTFHINIIIGTEITADSRPI